MIHIAYDKYLKLPLATVTGHRNESEIYNNQWCVLTGLAFMHPHPHRHYTEDEFREKYFTDPDFKQRFPISTQEYEAWREQESIELEARGVITPRIYKKLHEVCPQCHKNEYSCTFVGPIYIWGQDYKDTLNTVRCTCGWSGKRHDLVPNPNK